MRLQPSHRIGAVGDRHTKSGGDAVSGDVIMRWPDATGGEHMVKSRTQVIHGSDDPGVIIGDHPRLKQTNAMLGQALRQMVHVRIPGAPRQDFIADHQHGGGWVGHDCLRVLARA